MLKDQRTGITRSLRQSVRARLGRTSDITVLDNCILTFGLFSPGVEDGPFKSPPIPVDKESTLIGAEITRAVIRASAQTYEGKVLLTGILVCRPERCIDPLSMNNPQCKDLFLLHFKPEKRIDWNDSKSFIPFAQLVDGKNSILLCDTSGLIYGIVDIGSYGIPDLSFSNNGYAIVTTKNREVKIYDIWRGGDEPVARFDGFEWSNRGTILEMLSNWYQDRQLLAGNFIWVRINGGVIEPAMHDMYKWNSFCTIMDYLSEVRLSAILVISDPEAYKELLQNGSLSPLRPELQDVSWEDCELFGLSHLSLFRLDGAHIISNDLKILSVAQRIVMPDSQAQTASGAGRTAAKHLSHLLGDRGIVIKISSDGPITVYYCGDQQLSPRKEIDYRILVSKIDGPYPSPDLHPNVE